MARTDSGIEPTAGERIVICACSVGAISFLAGFIGPLVFSPGNNLGPLLGIFITGPIGFLFGAALGIVWTIAKTQDRVGRSEMIWWFIIFFLALCGYYFLANSFKMTTTLVPISLASLMILFGVIVLTSKRLRQNFPAKMQRYGAVVMIAATVMVLMAIFPPVTEPWWVPSDARLQNTVDVAMPRFAFFLDSRFDASRSYPEFTVNEATLAFQWFLTGAVAAIVCLLVAQPWKKQA